MFGEARGGEIDIDLEKNLSLSNFWRAKERKDPIDFHQTNKEQFLLVQAK